MSDTDEWPVVKRPEPPRELWEIWNATLGEPARVNGSTRRMHCFTDQRLAEGYAASLSRVSNHHRHEFVAYRLIPPAE